MENQEAVRRYEEAARFLPARLRAAALALSEADRPAAEEFRLRTGRPLAVLLPEGERESGAAVTPADLEDLCDLATDYSRYAAAETLRCGYLAVRGGFRVGLCGTAVMKERGLHLSAGRVLRRGPHRPGEAGDRGGGGPPAVPGGAVSEHTAALSAGRRQDHAAAGPGAVPLRRRRRSGGPAGVPHRRAGRGGGDGPGGAPDGCGPPDRRAGRLSQGAGHPHGPAGHEPPGHRRGRDHGGGGPGSRRPGRRLRRGAAGHHPRLGRGGDGPAAPVPPICWRRGCSAWRCSIRRAETGERTYQVEELP